MALPFTFQRTTLKSWVEPWDEARFEVAQQVLGGIPLSLGIDKLSCDRESDRYISLSHCCTSSHCQHYPHSFVSQTTQVVVALKEELSAAHANLNRLQQEADTKVLARANSNNGSRQGGGAGDVVNKVPVSLEVKSPPVELRSSGEVLLQSSCTP